MLSTMNNITKMLSTMNECMTKKVTTIEEDSMLDADKTADEIIYN